MVQRAHRLPNANRPELLTRVLELIARGVRSTRALEEALGLDPRTVNYYTQAGQWLGLLEEPDLLSPLGLEYVFVEKHRPELYARAVWSQPLAAQLLGNGKTLPSVDAVTKFVLIVEPDIATATIERRVSALRALLAPVIGVADPECTDSSRVQLSLPLPAQDHEEVFDKPGDPTPMREWSGPHDPDGYRMVLSTLLDQGELEFGRLRAMLDREGADDLELEGFVSLAADRGDAVQIDTTLRVTAGAIARRDIASTTASIMLSDPGYRRYLSQALVVGGDPTATRPTEKEQEKYHSWDMRIFGHVLQPDRLAQDLEEVLLERPLSSFPLAGRSGMEVLPTQAPFLSVIDRDGLVVCLPPALAHLREGLAGVNRLLDRDRLGGDRVLPGLADRTRTVHGGLFYPGETPLKSIPDLRSMRMRVVAHSPYISLLSALLLAHRQRPRLLGLVKQEERWGIAVHGKWVGDLLPLMDEFMVSRGWFPCRRVQGGLTATQLLEALAVIGIVALFDRQAVMTERFFVQLRRDVEEQEIGVLLAPLVDAFEKLVVVRGAEPPYSEVVSEPVSRLN